MRNLLPNSVQAWATMALLVVIGLFHSSAYLPLTIDDAFITYTYSKNLANGSGPVFIPGERVEAASSFLWALALAPFEFLGIGALVGSKALGLLFMLLTVLLSAVLVRAFLPTRLGASGAREQLIVAILLLSFPPFVLWSVYGMENALCAFLLVLAVLLFGREVAHREGVLSFVPIFLLQTVRPEGFMFILLFVGVRLCFLALKGFQKRWVWIWALLLTTALLLFEAWGWSYYGYLLPNSAAAKAGGLSTARIHRGIEYLLTFPSGVFLTAVFASTLLVVPFVLLAPRGFLSRKRFIAATVANISYLLALAIVGLQMVFVVAVGGDWMPSTRFLSHVTPLLFAAAVATFSRASVLLSGFPGGTGTRRFYLLGFLGIYLLAAVYTTRRTYIVSASFHESEERALTGMAEYLNAISREEDVVSCGDIGRMGYYFKGSVLDWWGLTDEEIARTGEEALDDDFTYGKLKPRAVLEREPRFIVLYSNQPWLDETTMSFGAALSSRHLYDLDEFRRHYSPIHTLYFSEGRYHVLFERQNDPLTGARD